MIATIDELSRGPLRFHILLSTIACLSLLSAPFLCSAYSPSSVSVWSTTPVLPSVRLSSQPGLSFTSDACTAGTAAGLPEVTIGSAPLQPLVGFGAALTESAAYNFLQLKARNASAYSELLLQLFAPPPQGIAMSFMRVPITSCDLSLPTSGWSYDDTPNDVTLSHFNASYGMKYQLPVLQDIMQLARSYGLQINLIGTPWSAPSWIKNPQGDWNMGTIQNGWYDWYVSYLVDVVATFQSLGIPLYALSLQNEPTYEWNTYPATILSALNESVLANALQPALRAKGLSTLVVAWDSDWDNIDYPLEVLDRVNGDGQSVDAVAFHCYSNAGPQAQALFHQQYPDTLVLHTECSGFGQEVNTTDFASNWLYFLPLLYFNNFANWGSSAHHWALSLDLNYGPQTGGGCINCASVVTVDADNSSRPYVVQFSSEYYMIGHFSSFIPPMSRLLTTSSSALANSSGLLALAALTPDQSVVVQLLNTGSSTPLTVLVRDQQARSCYVATVAPQSLSTHKYSTSSSSSSGGSGLSSGGKAAIVIVVLLVAAVLCAAAVWWYRKRSVSGSQRYRGRHDEGMGVALS